ncbi:hypothetical protein ARMGADRAFT_1080552 [Armillaria gallica]|uniref:Uncharacterized protein n=1 Tax=Armillaria gallica TaxID=47427 RepID=A0A2H3DB70_ARMGA|nr:hypothetical protein ARMGADRAFT_1080552 [Armillaria gallica]
MVHRFLNAAKAHWRNFSTLKQSAREVNSNSTAGGIEKYVLTHMTPEEMHKKMRDMVGLTDDDMKALAPLPDENDPGIFEHEPRPDDDVRTHVLVGDSQCLLTNYLCANVRGDHLHDGTGPLLGVVRTNGYGLEDDLKDETKETEKLLESTPDDLKCKVGRYTSVFKDLSRINHRLETLP